MLFALRPGSALLLHHFLLPPSAGGAKVAESLSMAVNEASVPIVPRLGAAPSLRPINIKSSPGFNQVSLRAFRAHKRPFRQGHFDWARLHGPTTRRKPLVCWR